MFYIYVKLLYFGMNGFLFKNRQRNAVKSELVFFSGKEEFLGSMDGGLFIVQ